MIAFTEIEQLINRLDVTPLGREYAMRHCVTTWSLLTEIIAPRFFQPGANLRNRNSELVSTMGAAFCGENSSSQKIVHIVSALTGRTDLALTTMSFCKGFVSPRYLVNVHQSWCIECLAEAKDHDQELYYPLLWQITGVKVCPKHGIPLQSKCPECQLTFNPLKARTQPGHCHRCHAWLGITSPSSSTDQACLAKELAASRAIEQFLADGPKVLSSSTKSLFPQNIETLLHSHFDGNLARLKRFLGVSRDSVLAWKDRGQRPSMVSLADFSLRVNVPMSDLLGKSLSGEHFEPQSSDGATRSHSLFPSPPKTDLVKMRAVLEAAAQVGNPAPSINHLAIQLKCNQSTIARRFPELTERIKANYKQSVAKRIADRSQNYRSLVDEAVMSIYRAGDYPSQAKVRDKLQDVLDMREPVAMQAWKDALVKLQLCSA